MSEDSDGFWYAVRCVFGWSLRPEAKGKTYEERVTLWRASSEDEAIARAETDALEYATNIEDSPRAYLGLAQCYRLADPPGDGAEVFSMMRDSDLAPHVYLDSFFSTGTERQRHL